MKAKVVSSVAIWSCPIQSLNPDHYTDSGDACRCEEKAVSPMDDYWAGLHAQLDAIKAGPQTADHVIEVCQPPSSADAFFAGGMDRDLEGELMEAGWRHVWAEASYYWAMLPPGETDHAKGITYVEGDIYRGIQKPLV